MLTLPLLIFLGLPSAVANGTNRVSILVQNAAAVWSFRRDGLLEWRWLGALALPALVGSALGSWVALGVGEIAFRRLLAAIMIAVAVWTLWDPLARLRERERPIDPLGRSFLAFAFFGIGLFGGFIQAGVGFLILAVIPFAGLDLVRGNALKVLTILVFTPISLLIFAANGKIDWPLGTALAVGTFLGGLAGARASVALGHSWIKLVVTVVVVIFALKLWISG